MIRGFRLCRNPRTVAPIRGGPGYLFAFFAAAARGGAGSSQVNGPGLWVSGLASSESFTPPGTVIWADPSG